MRRKRKIVKSRVFILLVLLVISFSLYSFSRTYGLFESNKVEVLESGIAKWNINVNGVNVTESTSFVIDEVVTESNGFVMDGKIAPNTSGYFDIVIDGTNTDVSFRYDIKFDFSNLDISNLKIVNIEEVNFNSLIRTGEDIYTGIISLDDIRSKRNNLVRVHVKWENMESSNEEDSVIGLDSDYDLSIPVSITFMQYLGEEIVEYTE